MNFGSKGFYAVIAVIVLLVAGVGWFGARQSESSPDREIVFGWMGPLTGDAAAYGRSIQNGTLLALEEAGYKVPKTGRSVRVLFEDDKAEPALGRTVFKYLSEKINTPLIVQAAGSSVMLANIPEAQNRKIVYISPSCSSDRIKGTGQFTFRTWPSDSYQADFLSDVVSRKFHARTAAVLYIDNAYGSGLADAFRRRFTASGGKIVIFEPVQVGGTDFRAQLLRVKDASPDIIFTPVQALEAARLIRQARELQLNSKIFADAVLFSQDFLSGAGDAANGVYVSNLAWNPGRSDAARSFAQKYQARFKSPPDIYAAAGYDNAAMLLAALSSTKNTQSGLSIAASLHGLPTFHGVTGDLRFDDKGEVHVPYELNQIIRGSFVLVK